MKLDRRSALLLFGLALLVPAPALVPSSASAAQEDWAGARRFMQTKHAELSAGMRKARDPKTDPELMRIFDGMLDYPHFVRESLGEHWDQLDPGQQARFAEVLQKLVRGSYRKSLKDISGYEVQYTGESDGESGVLVATLAADPKKKRQDPLRIDYVVGKGPNGFLVRDIVTGGVSLLRNYKRQFARIIKKESFDALMAKMENQLKRVEEGQDPG
jgi:phospholipid transport system substrate-binding protein